MQRTLLLTGFEPFGGDRFNPSGSIALSLDGHLLEGGTIIRSLTLPVSGAPAWQKLSRAVRRVKPHWIVATGVSGRAAISWECTAWNEDDYRIPDNSGNRQQGARILSHGPANLGTGLFLGPHLTAWDCNALPINSSTDPGRYVCNHLYYRLLHLTKNPTHCAHGRSVFLHLPCTPEMRRGPEDTRFFHPLPEVLNLLWSILNQISKGQPAHPPPIMAAPLS